MEVTASRLHSIPPLAAPNVLRMHSALLESSFLGPQRSRIPLSKGDFFRLNKAHSFSAPPPSSAGGALGSVCSGDPLPLSSFLLSASSFPDVSFSSLFLAVGVGLPCTVMECGDVVYRSTLAPADPFKLTVGGVTLLAMVGAYLWATPGVAPGFWDMFVLAPLERVLRPSLSKADLSLGKKLGSGSYGAVFRATLKEGRGRKGMPSDLVVKRASEFGAVEIWMNERVRRACPSACADFVAGFLEPSRGALEDFWLVWRYEGDSTFADILANKDFPYNVEEAVLGSVSSRSLEREAAIIRSLAQQILTALQSLHSIGIVHRDVKPQNMIFNADNGSLKIIDLGAAADLRVGINYKPNEFLLDPRYAAPEQYIMSKQTPSAPPPPLAATLSPVLWQLNRPDCFDIYSAGLILLQMAIPSLRSDSGLISFNRQLKRCNYDLAAWRETVEGRKGGVPAEMLRGLALLDLNGGHGWALVQQMMQFKPKARASARLALTHPFFYPRDAPLLLLQRVRLSLLRLLYRDNTALTQAFLTFMARSGSEETGGFTEAQLSEMRDKERKRQKNKQKASFDRSVLAGALLFQRKLAKTLSTTMAEEQEERRKEKWWNRWQS